MEFTIYGISIEKLKQNQTAILTLFLAESVKAQVASLFGRR